MSTKFVVITVYYVMFYLMGRLMQGKFSIKYGTFAIHIVHLACKYSCSWQ